MTLNYMNRDQLCTAIRADFKNETVSIVNYTDDLLHRAFGCIENPSWADFEYFLEDRCFPRTRYNLKELLEEMDLPMYDPLLIIGKTKGRVYGDYQWIDIVEE